MAERQQLTILKQGKSAWNKWKEEHPDTYLNLREVDFYNADLSGIKLMEANLQEADLRKANLRGAKLSRANLQGAILYGADLSFADLSEADLSNADLHGANLTGANLTRANLTRANLMNATLMNCYIYGISAWDVQLDGTVQQGLIITSTEQPMITVDNLEVAQFIYLLLNNENIRNIFNSLSSKIVLILGHFSKRQKNVLTVFRDKLRQYNYLPVLLDLERTSNHNLTEIVRSFANISHFIIADITSPGNIPQELQAIVSRRAVPILPLLQGSSNEFTMFNDFVRYPWVLRTCRYKDFNDLLSSFTENIIQPLESKAQELEDLKVERSYNYTVAYD